MTTETYIPITPATRIPFPCWLWDTEFGWIDRKQPVSSANLLSLRITHYCTSATEPVGRPGEKDDDKVFRKKFVATLEGSTEDASTTVPTGRPEELQGPTEDGYANYHDSLSSPAVPTASGATGPSTEQRKEWHQPCPNQTAALSRIQTLIRRLRYRGDDYNADIAELELLPFLSASRPAVAQEWEDRQKLSSLYADIGDQALAEARYYKNILHWLHDCSTGTVDPEGYEWGVYRVKWNEQGKPESVLHTLSDLSDIEIEMAREKDVALLAKLRAMSSQPEGK